VSRVTRQELSLYTGQSGGANSILHFGRRHTPKLYVQLVFRDGQNENTYEFTVVPTDKDSLVFENETIYYRDMRMYQIPYVDNTWSGQNEATIAESPSLVAKHVRRHLESYRVYHFHV
jgi:hypothetical protein